MYLHILWLVSVKVLPLVLSTTHSHILSSSGLLHFNAESKLDKSLTPLAPNALQGEMHACFDVLFTQWLLSRESKTRLATVEALGYMCKVKGRVIITRGV